MAGLIVPDISKVLPKNKPVLVTFSGKLGDIVWALAAARELHRLGAVVDFATMPDYAATHELIAAQPYIREELALEGWEPLSDQCGVQPWCPPQVPGGYGYVFHFTYRSRPVVPLIESAGRLYGFSLTPPVLPFLEVGEVERRRGVVTYAFNPLNLEPKQALLERLQQELPNLVFEDVSTLSLLAAARAIKSAQFFFGCRSLNFVLANGVGQRCLTIEPEEGRREPIFGCPYGTEVMPDVNDFEAFLRIAKEWAEEA